jgi:hypothetical protein
MIILFMEHDIPQLVDDDNAEPSRAGSSRALRSTSEEHYHCLTINAITMENRPL